jgi:hypothetical protein
MGQTVTWIDIEDSTVSVLAKGATTVSDNAASSSRQPIPRRPRIPEGYGQTRSDNPPGTLLGWPTVEDWLLNARTYWVTTTCPDGRPHAVPLWGVWIGDALGFSTGAETATARNLSTNSSALAHPGNGDQVAIIEGTVEGFPKGSALTDFAEQYRRKYNWAFDPDAPPGPIFRLTADRVLSWDAETDLVQTMSRWEFSG